MASSTTGGGHYLFLVALLALLSSTAYGHLSATYGEEFSENYYITKCPKLNDIIEEEVRASFKNVTEGRRMGASLLRLFFHDCFVQGCDASVLLDDDPTKVPAILSEKNALPNRNSLRGFTVIDRIKDKVEKQCPGIVSCADILALAAKQAVIALGGPAFPLSLGRHDSTTANMTQANTDLPSPDSDLNKLIAAFQKKGFSPRELVALSGGHTIGLAHCSNVDKIQQNKTRCNTVNSNDLPPLDKSAEMFDNVYYKNLPEDGMLHSDRVLVDRADLKVLVGQYAYNQDLFFHDFAMAIERMSEMGVLTGRNYGGQIRRNCRKVNNY